MVTALKSTKKLAAVNTNGGENQMNSASSEWMSSSHCFPILNPRCCLALIVEFCVSRHAFCSIMVWLGNQKNIHSP